MKILYLTPGCFDKGGISRYTRYQISALREIVGHADVRVFSFLGPDADGFEHPFQVDGHGRGSGAIDKAEFLLKVAARAVRDRPDMIFAAHVNLAGSANALARLLRADVVLNCYGHEVWSGLRRDAHWGVLRSRSVIADCHFTAQYLEDNDLRPRGTTTVIWDCVDIDRFSPGVTPPELLARYKIPDPATGINLLTLGRLSRSAAHKGYERLLEVFARVASRVPTLRLVVAGRGDLAPLLASRARALGVSDRVHFTGAVHEDDLPGVYRSAHIFSLMSDRGIGRGEGLPLTPLEAAASGVPILVGNLDGSREAAESGVEGFVLDPFDLDAHAEAIVRLASSPDERARMGLAARARATREFSYDRFVTKHRRFLDGFGR